jgi:hypothetical protein
VHDIIARARRLSITALVLGALAVAPAAAQADFGIASFATTVSTSQAGAHPDFSTSFTLNKEPLGNPIGQIRDATTTLPPGLVGNPQATERCSIQSLETFVCSRASQVGVISLAVVACQGLSTPLEAPAEAGATTVSVPNAKAFCTEESGDTVTVGAGASAEQARVIEIVNSTTLRLEAPLTYAHPAGEPIIHIATASHASVSLFNVEPTAGHVATFAASLLFADIYVQLNVGANGRLTATLSETSTVFPVEASTITLWGVPASPSHDALRCGELIPECGPSSAEPTPFVTNPTACTGPTEAELSVTSWQGQVDASTATLPTPTGCEQLTITPTLAVTPSTTQRDTPSGYEVGLRLPQEEEPYGLATPALKTVSVSLPSGTSLSPGFANGLQTCSEIAFTDGNCPVASKIGTAEIATPMLPDHLTGGIYIGTPTATERYRIVMSVKADDTTIDLEGHAEPDETTGQVTAVFNGLPQLPFSDLKLVFFGGPTAAFANPPTCGPATSTSQIISYAGDTASPSSTFVVDEDGNGGACPPSQPFAPTFVAGTTDPLAGSFSPFTLTISRADSEESLSRFTAKLPAGLVGLLTSVPLCPEPAAAEDACAMTAEVGTATIGAGAGPEQLYLSGPVYLTGPYDGAPFGLAVVVNASAGPFSLGTVILRSRVLVDPTTMALTIASDPIPQILGGMPLRLRTINLTLSRPGFLFNPTDCSSQTVTGTLVSNQGAITIGYAPFKVGGCMGLPFAPTVTASTRGYATSGGAGGAFAITIIAHGGPPSNSSAVAEANIRSVIVKLPKQLKARLDTLRQACRAPMFAGNPTSCPPGAVIGTGTVRTPVLNSALVGPIYLISHGGAAFPSLAMVLRAEGVSVTLAGVISIAKNGVISSTFRTLPDVPVTLLNLNFPEGPHSAFGAIGKLCGQKLTMPTTIEGDNGKRIIGRTAIAVTGCVLPKRRSQTASH